MCLATLACSFALAIPCIVDAPSPGKPALAKVLAAWNRLYRAGNIELAGSARSNGKDAKVYGRGYLPPNNPAFLTHIDAFEHLLKRAREIQSKPICRELLLLATVGLDDRRLPPHRLPSRVRLASLKVLGSFTNASSLDFIQHVATEARKAWGHIHWHPAIQVAAVRALGMSGNTVFRRVLEKQLENDLVEVQIAASEAIGKMQVARSLPALTRALQTNKNTKVCQALIRADIQIIDANMGTLSSVDIRAALKAAIATLGHSDWRCDLAVIELLKKYRILAAIPALIEVLDRFSVNSGTIASSQFWFS